MASKRCYYKVLNVNENVTDEDLKKSYRKLALRWHLDKNPDNVEESRQEFIQVQQAFEVLIDPQERAFYDRHRESILRGAKSNYKDETLDVFEYFTSSCYSGFDDSEKSFYSVYREVFNKIEAEESEYMAEDDEEAPSFGYSKSSFDDMKHFYDYWLDFCTKKSFSWVDLYDIRDGENRFTFRMIQQENKKVRDKAKKERNEQIRALVAFVRKRDKRAQAYRKYLKEKNEDNIRKAEENQRKALAKNRKDLELFKESEWCKFSNIENELREIENEIASEFNDHGDSNKSETDEVCVACNKSFKTEKAFANHEKSKKHRVNVASTKTAFVNHQKSRKHPKSMETLNDSNNDVIADDRCSESQETKEELNGGPSEDEGFVSVSCCKLKKKKKGVQSVAYVTPEAEVIIDLHKVAISKKQKKKLEREKIMTNNSSATKLSRRIARIVKALLREAKPAPPEPKYMNDVIDFTGLDHWCAYCNQSFISNKKLLKHLNSTGMSPLYPMKPICIALRILGVKNNAILK